MTSAARVITLDESDYGGPSKLHTALLAPVALLNTPQIILDCDMSREYAIIHSKEMVMDSAHKSNRKYSAFTTAELRKFVSEGPGEFRDQATLDKMQQEIMARDAGISVPFVVPQIGGGRPTVKVGRM